MKESYNQPNLSNDQKLKEHAKRKAIEAVKNSKVSIVNAEHLAEMEARDAADAHMTESKGQAGFWKKLWKHTFFDEYYRQKELAKVRNQISKSENIYTAIEQDKKAHDGAMQAITTRFTSEYDEAINKDAGEDREKLEEKNFGTMEVKSKVRRLISDYAQTNMSEEIFKVEKKKIIDNISDHKLLNGASTYADNLFEIAKNARLAIEHGAKLEELDLDFDIIVGKAKSSIKTEAKHSWADTAVDKLKKTQIGRFVNPATLSTAVGIAYTAVTATGKIGTMFGKSKVAAYTTFGATAVVSGVLAGMNESQRLAEERRQHGRETAKGAKIEGDSPRRESMEKYAYQTESASNLTKNLRESLFTKDANGKEIPKNISESELAIVLQNITNIEARESLAQSKKIDLVTYSHPGQVEKEKTELVILLARAKVEARKQLESKFGNFLPEGETFDTYLNKQSEMTKRAFLEGEKGIDSRDKAFKWLKARRFGLVASKTILIGVTVGALAQELVAGVDGLWGGQREGVVEGIIHQVKGENTSNQIQTPLNHVREWITGSPSHIGANGIDQLIGENHFNLPEGASITPNGDGTYDINIGDRQVADNIPLTFENGALDQASIDRLGEAGIVANTCTNVIENAGVTEVNAQDYIDQHPDATHEIKRIGWHDNDTPAPTFDQNELKMHWGGENGTGVNSNGDYVFNVSHMTSGGSFHENLSVDAQEKIKNGELKVLLAFTRETQNHVVEGIVDTNGNVTFDHTDPVIQELFHVDDKGHAIYDGRFAEVAETFGNNSKGAEMVRLLATHEGLGNDCITVPGPKDVPINILDLPLDDEPPYFIPFAPRTPLEPMKYKKPIEPPPIPTQKNMERMAYMRYNEKIKGGYTDLNLYRNNNEQIDKLISSISSNEKLNKKFGFMVSRIETLKNYKDADSTFKQTLLKETYLYNRRYSVDNPISIDEFVKIELKKLHSQIENIYIENSEVGGKPFAKDFYEKSPLIKGLDNCKEIVIILDDPIGDAVLTLPLIISINRYLELNKINKQVKVVSRTTPALYKYLEDQFSNVKIVSSVAEASKNKNDKFIINTNKVIDTYLEFNLPEADIKNPSKIMSVDWASWQKEESPIDAHHMTKYDPLPSRIARSFEIMTGQKLFKDIKNTEKYIERNKNFETESKEIKSKYNVKDGEKIITISAGSSVVPKEYSPEKWQELIKGIFEKYPNAHILFLDDPEPTRKARYGEMLDKLIAEKGYNISRTNEKLDKMNTILSMSDTVITPDTGLGHYAAGLGTKTVMLYLSDPVLWSAPGVKRVIHEKGYETYRKGVGSYSRAWDIASRNDYYVEDNGVMVGASDITPEEILRKMEESLVFTKTRGLSSLSLKSTPSVEDDTVPTETKKEEKEEPKIPAVKKTTMVSKPIEVKRDTLKPTIQNSKVKIVNQKVETGGKTRKLTAYQEMQENKLADIKSKQEEKHKRNSKK